MAFNPEQELINDIAAFYDDPYKFVMYVFPWGEDGELRGHKSPDKWQTELLKNIGNEVKRREAGDIQEALRVAVTSGHGVGKSALTSWILLWFISTRPNPQILVTANTMPQLSTKTWRELAKWHKLAINKHWFEWTATKFYLKEQPNTWFASAIPWTEHRSEAFAGMHEEHVLVLYDEASGIVDKIWEVTEGAMTTPGAMWFAFGNPTQNTGRFRECFGRFKHRWINYKVDSRDARMASKQQIDQWIEDYGEDSDFARIRIKGEFPRASSTQFIPTDQVEACVTYEADNYQHMPYIFGVDVARFGDDQSVILLRQGRKVHLIQKFRGLDTVQLSHRLMELAQGFMPNTIFIDGVGVGSGVVDYCRSLKLKVIEVNAGSSPKDSKRYFNKRAEMWGDMRDWIKGGASIPNDADLIQELTSLEYGFTNQNQIMLEKKSDIKRRGLSSPDVADALSLTFAESIAPIGLQSSFGRLHKAQRWSPY